MSYQKYNPMDMLVHAIDGILAKGGGPTYLRSVGGWSHTHTRDGTLVVGGLSKVRKVGR